MGRAVLFVLANSFLCTSRPLSIGLTSVRLMLTGYRSEVDGLEVPIRHQGHGG
jgi:hypothetical protein